MFKKFLTEIKSKRINAIKILSIIAIVGLLTSATSATMLIYQNGNGNGDYYAEISDAISELSAISIAPPIISEYEPVSYYEIMSEEPPVVSVALPVVSDWPLTPMPGPESFEPFIPTPLVPLDVETHGRIRRSIWDDEFLNDPYYVWCIWMPFATVWQNGVVFRGYSMIRRDITCRDFYESFVFCYCTLEARALIFSSHSYNPNFTFDEQIFNMSFFCLETSEIMLVRQAVSRNLISSHELESLHYHLSFENAPFAWDIP